MPKDKITLKVQGKNIFNFINRMNKLKIELLNIKYDGVKNAVIEIYKKDYEKVLKNKTIYEIEIKDVGGLTKVGKQINSYKYIIIFILSSFFIIWFLSNLIFRIEIVSNDSKMKQKIMNYLNEEGLKLYHFKQNYKKLKQVKEGLLNKFQTEIDWVEIDSIGSKYIVRYEPRVQTNLNIDSNYQSIIAKRNAIVYSMNIKKGQIIKNRFDYVKKGDVIVSGYIYLNEQIKDTVKAEGVVYGETWYKVNVKYPLKYLKKTKTGKSKKVLIFNFLNHELQFFNFHKYKFYQKKNNILLKNNLLPIFFSWQEQLDVKIEKENNSYKSAKKKAIESAKNKIKKSFDSKSYIKDYKILSEKKEGNDVVLEVFISAIEPISEYQSIEEYIEQPTGENQVE